MVFQDARLLPWRRVLSNVMFGLEKTSLSKAERVQRATEALKLVGLAEMGARWPHQLSGGQRQRVALGRAIVRNPQCFLFDEPLSNLDAKLRVSMRAEIKQLHLRLGSTTVYVTHDQEEAMTLGDRVVVMKDGVIQQSGGALEIYHLPANRFVAGFLGSPQMNFLRGKLREEGGALIFDEGSGKLPVPPWARAMLAGARGGDKGEEVVLGIRPESLGDSGSARLPNPTDATRGRLNMTVKLVQTLGDRLNVYLSTPDHDEMVAQVPVGAAGAARFRVGDVVPIAFDMNAAHFFAPGETGAALASNRERWGAATAPLGAVS
jgi:multiple sugar transport system ATP-binding protein